MPEFEGIEVPVYVIEKRKGFDFTLPFRLQKIIKKNSVDLIHTNNAATWLYGGLTKLMFWQVKLVHTEHSNVPVDKRRLLKAGYWLEKISDFVIADAKVVLDFMSQRQGINTCRAKVIYNGINLKKFNCSVDVDDFKRKIGVPPEDKVIGIIARLMPVKNHKFLLKAFCQILRDVDNVSLLIVGKGVLKEDLIEMVKEFSMSSKVFFLGERRDVHNILKICDIVTLCSLNEGLPVALLEALASGIPVVATDVGGAREIIEDGKNGYLIPLNDLVSYQNRIIQLLLNDASRKKMALNAFASVKEKFPISKMVQEYSFIYESVFTDFKTASKKVLMYVNYSLNIGGIETLIFEKSKRLNKDKYKVCVCVFESAGALIPEFEKNGIEVFILNKRKIFDVLLPFKLACLLKRLNVNIVHTHNQSAWLYGGIATKLSGKTLIHTEHTTVDSHEYLNKHWLLIERILALFTAQITTVSKSVKDFMVKNEGIKAEKIMVVYNGVAPETYQITVDIAQKKSSMGISKNDFVVGNVSRLVRNKDHENLLKAFKLMTEKIDNIKLLLIGSGPLKPELVKVAESLEIADKIIFTGNRRDVPEILKIIDVFVLSSIREGFPVVLLEAMSSGLPIVTTDVDGNGELVIDEENGYVVEARNSAALADATLRILNNKQVSQEMSNKNVLRINARFTFDMMLENYEKIYNKVDEMRQRIS